eukprot:GHVH01007936.1.p1 GENE.GHVH01007936.1~~GHVH01007936.1.p1  ORF type:complete len:254 (-),score=26.59 GHVH01007936.1:10-771(-)
MTMWNYDYYKSVFTSTTLRPFEVSYAEDILSNVNLQLRRALYQNDNAVDRPIGSEIGGRPVGPASVNNLPMFLAKMSPCSDGDSIAFCLMKMNPSISVTTQDISWTFRSDVELLPYFPFFDISHQRLNNVRWASELQFAPDASANYTLPLSMAWFRYYLAPENIVNHEYEYLDNMWDGLGLEPSEYEISAASYDIRPADYISSILGDCYSEDSSKVCVIDPSPQQKDLTSSYSQQSITKALNAAAAPHYSDTA